MVRHLLKRCLLTTGSLPGDARVIISVFRFLIEYFINSLQIVKSVVLLYNDAKDNIVLSTAWLLSGSNRLGH